MYLLIDIGFQAIDLEDKLSELELEVEFLEADKSSLIDDLNSFKSEFESADTQGKDSIIESSWKLSVNEELELLRYDQDYREYKDLMMKYKNELFPELSILEEMKHLSNEIKKKTREISMKSLKIGNEASKGKSKTILIIVANLFLTMTFIIGYTMAKSGFKDWKDKIQDPLDFKLQSELSGLEIKG